MTIPTALLLSASDLTLTNSSINSDSSIAVSNSEIKTALSIEGGLINEIGCNLVNSLFEIPVDNTSTEDQLIVSSADFNLIKASGSFSLIENNEITNLDNNIDYSLKLTSSLLGNLNKYYELGSTLAFNSGFIYNGFAYVFGGWTGAPSANIYYATYNSSTGVIGDWQLSDVKLNVATLRYCLVQNGNYVYIFGGDGNTVQYTSINSDGSLNPFTTSPNSLPFNYSYNTPVGFYYNGFIYTLTMYQQNSSTNMLYYAPINSDNSPGVWVAQTMNISIPNTACIAAVQNNGYYYIIGGGSSNVYSLTNCYYGTINSDGSLGDLTATASLPIPYRYLSVVIYDGYMYCLNGVNAGGGLGNPNIYISKINSDGSLGEWLPLPDNNPQMSIIGAYGYDETTFNFFNLSGILQDGQNTDYIKIGKKIDISSLLNKVPSYVILSNGILINGYYYILGGMISTTPLNTVFFASYDATSQTFGEWGRTTNLPTTLGSMGVCYNNGYIYIIGGNTNISNFSNSTFGLTSSVYYAIVNSDGSLGEWNTNANALPEPLSFGNAIVNTGYIYLIGSWNNSGNNTSIYYASINSDGSLGVWSSQSGVFSSDVSGASLVTSGNNYYVVGGSNYTLWSLSSVYLLTLDPTTNVFTSTTLTSLPVALRRPNAYIYNNTLYVQDGGDPDTSFINENLYSATINSDGTIGSWVTSINPYIGLYGNVFTYDYTNNNIINIGGIFSLSGVGNNTKYSNSKYIGSVKIYSVTDTSLSSNILYSVVPYSNNFSALVPIYNNDFLYIISPYENGSGGSGSGQLYTLDIKTNTWSTTTCPALNGAVSFLYNNTIYLIGGFVGYVGETNAIYYAVVNSDGSLGDWTKSSVTFPITIGSYFNTYINSSYIYVLGGYTGQGSYSNTPNIYQATLTDTLITNWTLYPISLPLTTANPVIIGNESILLAIYSVSSNVSVYQSSVGSDGSLGDFSLVTINLNITGTLYNLINLGNDYFVLDVINGNQLYSYLGSINDMNAWELLSVSSFTTGLTSMYLNGIVYQVTSSTTYKEILNTNGSSLTYSINLQKPLSSIPSNIYFNASIDIKIKWNSWANPVNLKVQDISISNNDVSYTFNQIQNPFLVLESNYPKVYIETQSFSSTIKSFSFSAISYPT